MCRANVAERAQRPLWALLDNIAEALAEQSGVARSEVTIGPVDFGPDDPAGADTDA